MAFNYMVIINISIALVDMIHQPITTFDINTEMAPTWYACYPNNVNLNFTAISNTTKSIVKQSENIHIQRPLNTNRTFTFEYMILTFFNVSMTFIYHWTFITFRFGKLLRMR